MALIKRPDHRILTFLLTLLFSGAVYAGNLTLTPIVTLGYGQTNNLTLSEDNELSDSVLDISPAFDISYTSGKLSANLEYQLQSLHYTDNSDNDETFQQLDSLISTQIIDDTFWINLSNTIEQRSISDTADQQQNNIFSNGQITDVSDQILQPLLRFRNNNIIYELIASLSQQRFDNDSTINQLDSDTNDYSLSINSDNNSKLNWGINYFNSETEFSDNTENAISSAEALLNIAFSNQFRSTITVGRDDNDFDAIDSDTLDSDYWSTSLAWNPNNRLNFLLSGGERFDASDNSLSINYQGRYINLTLSSNRELITNGINTQNLNNQQPIQAPVLTNNVILRTFNTININYSKRKLQIGVTYSEDQRESQSTNDNEEVDENLTLDIRWQIQSRTALILAISKTDDETPDALFTDNRLDRLSINTLELNRRISANTELSFLIRSQKRRSFDSTLNYNEEGYQASFSHRF